MCASNSVVTAVNFILQQQTKGITVWLKLWSKGAKYRWDYVEGFPWMQALSFLYLLFTWKKMIVINTRSAQSWDWSTKLGWSPFRIINQPAPNWNKCSLSNLVYYCLVNSLAYIHLRNTRVSIEVEIHGVQTYWIKERGKDAHYERLTQNGTIVKMRTKPIKNIYVTHSKSQIRLRWSFLVKSTIYSWYTDQVEIRWKQ
jgi:hypothetical protein